MSYNLTAVTNAGNKLFNTIIDDNTKLTIDRVDVSATQLTSATNIKAMTQIDSVTQTTGVNAVSKGDASIVVKTVLSNKDIKTDYKAWVFGIYGHDEAANEETLLAVVTTTDTPDTVPAYDAGSPIALKYSFAIAFSNSANITINQINDEYAMNDDVVHITGDESIAGVKTFETIKIDNESTPSIVTTDGYNISLDQGTTKFVPANDATVVHATDMRKPADKVASIDEVNTKQDKLNYTAADDSKVAHLSGANNFDTLPTVNNKNLVTSTDLSTGLATKVTDNKDGTEQLNGVQIQPFNKLVDTVGVHNYIAPYSWISKGQYGYFSSANGILGGTDTQDDVHSDYIVPPSMSMTVTTYQLATSGNPAVQAYDSNKKWLKGYPFGTVGSTAIQFPTGTAYITISVPNPVTRGGLYKLENGTIETDWSPAPEDKVNVSDMRKPASDVAGIEEVVEYIRASNESDAVAKSKADPNNLYYWV